MAARNAIRDVGRVMGMPYQDVDVVAKQVPMELKMTLRRALEVSPELKRMYDTDPKVTELIVRPAKTANLFSFEVCCFKAAGQSFDSFAVSAQCFFRESGCSPFVSNLLLHRIDFFPLQC